MNIPLPKIIEILLIIYFSSIIVFRENFIYITYIVNIFMVLCFAVMLTKSDDKVFKVNSLIVFYALFTLISFLSVFWSVDIETSSKKSLQILLILLNLFVIYNMIIKYDLEETFLYGVLLATVINFLILLGLIPVSYNIFLNGDRAIGTTGNPNVLSVVMFLSIVSSFIFINKKEMLNRVFYYYQYINILACIYVVIMTASKKGVLFSLLIIITYLIISLRTVLGTVRILNITVLAIIAFIYFVNIETFIADIDYLVTRFMSLSDSLQGQGDEISSTSLRKELIVEGLHLFQDAPALGYGIDCFRHISFNGQYAHNNYIEILTGTGFIGIVAFYSFYIFVLRDIKNMKKSEVKYLLFTLTIVFILMDVALVTYANKIIIFSILYISIKSKKERDHKISNV